MRFIVLVKATQQSEAGALPDTKMLANMGAFNEQLAQAGIMLAGEGLHPSSKGARISFAGPKPTITDGPFTETKELVAGFWLLQAKSKAEIIEWLVRCPFENGEDVEIRQIQELADFGPDLMAELREQRARIEAQLSGQAEGAK